MAANNGCSCDGDDKKYLDLMTYECTPKMDKNLSRYKKAADGNCYDTCLGSFDDTVSMLPDITRDEYDKVCKQLKPVMNPETMKLVKTTFATILNINTPNSLVRSLIPPKYQSEYDAEIKRISGSPELENIGKAKLLFNQASTLYIKMCDLINVLALPLYFYKNLNKFDPILLIAEKEGMAGKSFEELNNVLISDTASDSLNVAVFDLGCSIGAINTLQSNIDRVFQGDPTVYSDETFKNIIKNIILRLIVYINQYNYTLIQVEMDQFEYEDRFLEPYYKVFIKNDSSKANINDIAVLLLIGKFLNISEMIATITGKELAISPKIVKIYNDIQAKLKKIQAEKVNADLRAKEVAAKKVVDAVISSGESAVISGGSKSYYELYNKYKGKYLALKQRGGANITVSTATFLSSNKVTFPLTIDDSDTIMNIKEKFIEKLYQAPEMKGPMETEKIGTTHQSRRMDLINTNRIWIIYKGKRLDDLVNSTAKDLGIKEGDSLHMIWRLREGPDHPNDHDVPQAKA
ncbi:MAG: hypothetical protein Hyperionvirus1_42 [Hyperionvirus sp.]|uniref:Ubiquitin-like domain-containing protein n=1 Tax=Hyperionvirus sp. TaxID=2487770 RepID=A0A3G5A9F4_9VIRU|nr:MAG: hypothetical protein Hyperionvirus1_42 [Hyperionvirus sp.]